MSGVGAGQGGSFKSWCSSQHQHKALSQGLRKQEIGPEGGAVVALTTPGPRATAVAHTTTTWPWPVFALVCKGQAPAQSLAHRKKGEVNLPHPLIRPWRVQGSPSCHNKWPHAPPPPPAALVSADRPLLSVHLNLPTTNRRWIAGRPAGNRPPPSLDQRKPQAAKKKRDMVECQDADACHAFYRSSILFCKVFTAASFLNSVPPL